ncbi:MAG: MFS transporter [Pseudomonadales bacterium]
MKASDPPELQKYQSALSVAIFRRYLPASCLNTFGGWVVRFLLGWSAWELTHSALWVGVVSGLMLAPSFLLSPVFGIISDRINPRNGLIVTVCLQALVACAGGVADLLGWYSLSWLLCLATLFGAVSSAHMPIRLALIPLLVPRTVLASAVGFSTIIFNTSRILAPAAAAWLITQISVANTFFTATILLVAALPFLMSVSGLPDRIQGESTSLFKQFTEGFLYLRRHSGIRLVFGYTLLNALLGRSVIELLPALSGQLLGGDAATLATLTASAGVGSILGGVIMSRQLSDERRMLSLLTLCLTAGTICLVPVAWLEGLMPLCAVIMSLSLVTTMVGTGSLILTQLLVADDYRGRVISLWAVLAMGGPALGVLVMGGLADTLGFPSVLPGFSLLCIAGIALLYRRRGQLSQSSGKPSCISLIR